MMAGKTSQDELAQATMSLPGRLISSPLSYARLAGLFACCCNKVRCIAVIIESQGRALVPRLFSRASQFECKHGRAPIFSNIAAML